MLTNGSDAKYNDIIDIMFAVCRVPQLARIQLGLQLIHLRLSFPESLIRLVIQQPRTARNKDLYKQPLHLRPSTIKLIYQDGRNSASSRFQEEKTARMRYPTGHFSPALNTEWGRFRTERRSHFIKRNARGTFQLDCFISKFKKYILPTFKEKFLGDV